MAQSMTFNLYNTHCVMFIVSVTNEGYVCFQENPLCAFSEFLMECVVKKNFKGSMKSLKAFKVGWFSMKINVRFPALYGIMTTFFFNRNKFQLYQTCLYMDFWISWYFFISCS